jgi:hypothetical protein
VRGPLGAAGLDTSGDASSGFVSVVGKTERMVAIENFSCRGRALPEGAR